MEEAEQMSTPSSNNAAVESNHNRMDEQGSDTFPNHVGYSLVNPATLSDKPLDEIDPPLTIQPPSHLTSLLYTVAEKLSTRHLFLRGPPKSGRSSLVMDLACELAVTTPCRCPDITSADTNSNSCSCIAVTLFLPVAEESNFPLHCQSVSTAFVTNMEYSSSQQSATAFSFPKQLLRRIQIRRVASLEDLLGQLFRMQGVLLPEQPSALLLDDLDRLCGSLAATPNLDRISSPSSGHADATKLHARESLVCKYIVFGSVVTVQIWSLLASTLRVLRVESWFRTFSSLTVKFRSLIFSLYLVQWRHCWIRPTA